MHFLGNQKKSSIGEIGKNIICTENSIYGYFNREIDRSCHIGPSWTSNCFDLNYPDNALYIKYVKKMDNQTYFSIQ